MKRVAMICIWLVCVGCIVYHLSHGVGAQALGQFSNQPQMRYAAATAIPAGTPVVSTTNGCAATLECVTPSTGVGSIAGIAITGTTANGALYVAQYGAAMCIFDSAPTVGDAVTVVAGACHDESINTRLNISQTVGFVGRVINVPAQSICATANCAYVNILAPGSTGLLITSAQMDPATMPAYIQANQLTSAGPQGPIGATGPAGAQGAQGIAGSVGPIGPAGPTGVTGVAGVAGQQGSQGLAGPMGVAGPAGAIGPAGVQGGTGASAYQVAQTNGFTGTVTAWLASLIGATGAQGIQGIAGATGASGATGAPGPAGASGATGNTGVAGPVGPAGPTGAVGASGPAGANGVAGPTGATGATGSTGPAGPSDLTGTTGSIGGSLLAVGACANATATVTGAVKGHRAEAFYSDGSLIGGAFKSDASVTSNGTVTVELCAIIAGTPAAKTMNVYVSQN